MNTLKDVLSSLRNERVVLYIPQNNTDNFILEKSIPENRKGMDALAGQIIDAKDDHFVMASGLNKTIYVPYSKLSIVTI